MTTENASVRKSLPEKQNLIPTGLRPLEQSVWSIKKACQHE